jgi:formylglycine-generating enzyme required for sulfatase activity
MTRRGYAAALVLIAACRISDLTFYQPGAAGDGPDAGSSDPAPTGDPDPAAPAFPSCKGLTATCGAAAGSCCESPVVPAGSFFRDFDVAGDPSSGSKNYPATIRSSFRLDRYDVTVARFRAFVAAGMGTQLQPPAADAGTHAQKPGSGWNASWNTSLEATTADLVANIKCSIDQTWIDVPGSADDENRPMNCITWFEAMAFCIWDGGYLPTEAEWNYAAVGGTEQRAYPWSSSTTPLAIDPSYASYAPGGGSNACTGDGMLGCTVTDIVPVGSLAKGDGRWGHADLAGNLEQWLLDWFAPYDPSCMDCIDLTMPGGTDPARVVRGGAFVYDKASLRTGARSNGYPTMRNYIHGFRCARPM